jgi:hypothetical protein
VQVPEQLGLPAMFVVSSADGAHTILAKEGSLTQMYPFHRTGEASFACCQLCLLMQRSAKPACLLSCWITVVLPTTGAPGARVTLHFACLPAG